MTRQASKRTTSRKVNRPTSRKIKKQLKKNSITPVGLIFFGGLIGWAIVSTYTVFFVTVFSILFFALGLFDSRKAS